MLDEVTPALFLVSFSQLPAAKKHQQRGSCDVIKVLLISWWLYCIWYNLVWISLYLEAHYFEQLRNTVFSVHNLHIMLIIYLHRNFLGKGGLISEKNSIFQKMCQTTILSIFSLKNSLKIQIPRFLRSVLKSLVSQNSTGKQPITYFFSPWFFS